MDETASLILALATENTELRQQLATAQDLLVETAIDAGNLHARIEVVLDERDAWRAEAERLSALGRQSATRRDGTDHSRPIDIQMRGVTSGLPDQDRGTSATLSPFGYMGTFLMGRVG